MEGSVNLAGNAIESAKSKVGDGIDGIKDAANSAVSMANAARDAAGNLVKKEEVNDGIFELVSG